MYKRYINCYFWIHYSDSNQVHTGTWGRAEGEVLSGQIIGVTTLTVLLYKYVPRVWSNHAKLPVNSSPKSIRQYVGENCDKKEIMTIKMTEKKIVEIKSKF